MIKLKIKKEKKIVKSKNIVDIITSICMYQLRLSMGLKVECVNVVTEAKV